MEKTIKGGMSEPIIGSWLYKCFLCGEIICRGQAVRFCSTDDKINVDLHDLCAIAIGEELIEMGKKGLKIARSN